MIVKKPASILVTDDESNVRLMVRTSLESEGYQVSEAADGKAALDAIRRSPPDLMVLDLNMPEIDGMAVLEELKNLALLNKPKVVVLTAYGSIATAVKATRLGAADFIEKPVSPADLRRAVFSVLEEPELDMPTTPFVQRGEYDQVLDRVRKFLRLACYTDAQTLLTKAAESRARSTAEYFNLLGVVYEAQRNWRLARKCYSKAMASDSQYAPARVNLQRVSELQSYKFCSRAVVMGDEDTDVLYAALPPKK